MIEKLSRKQRHILYYTMQELQDKEIAFRLDTAQITIKYHKKVMRRLFKVRMTMQVVTAILSSLLEPKVLHELNMTLTEGMER